MEDSYAKKKLPYNLNAEKSVIGSMLMDRDAIVDASDMLTKEDFIMDSMEYCLRTWWSSSKRAKPWIS